jgi:hypothetical protein
MLKTALRLLVAVTVSGACLYYALRGTDWANVGRLVAGGWFSEAGGEAASNVAAWDGAAWQALGTGVPMEVHALAQ